MNPQRIENCNENEVLACKKALENQETFRHEICGITPLSKEIVWETAEMPHTNTLEMMELMDGLRVNCGVNFPFEISPVRHMEQH